VSRWFAGAALLLAAVAAPSTAHATGFGGGATDLGIVLQPRRPDGLRADGCGRVVRGSVEASSPDPMNDRGVGEPIPGAEDPTIAVDRAGRDRSGAQGLQVSV
jgi:hypothetical protein